MCSVNRLYLQQTLEYNGRFGGCPQQSIVTNFFLYMAFGMAFVKVHVIHANTNIFAWTRL